MDNQTDKVLKTNVAKKSPKKKKLLIVEDDEIDSICDKCDISLLDSNFKKCIAGYHLINSSPVSDTVWEDINEQVFLCSGIQIHTKSNGSHLSGMDIDSSIGRMSNKSAKYSANKKSIVMSSYRLTTVCSDKDCGTPQKITEEINRRKNFDYYSIIVRNEEAKSTTIEYDWLLIPSNYIVMDPTSYSWEPTFGKRGKNKDAQVGWNTNEINGCSMTITFSMSSQLWIHIEMTEEIKKFIVASTIIENKPKFNYIDIFNKFN